MSLPRKGFLQVPVDAVASLGHKYTSRLLIIPHIEFNEFFELILIINEWNRIEYFEKH